MTEKSTVLAGTCWDYWMCSGKCKSKCKAHQTCSGKKCFVANGFAPQGERRFGECDKCPWYGCSREE